MLIRNKLTLLFTGLVLAIQLTLSGFVYAFYSVYRWEEFYGQLQAKARVFGRVLIGRQDVTHLLSARIPAGDLITLTDEQISIYDRQRQLLYDNHNAELDATEEKLLPRLLKKPGKPLRFAIGKLEGIGIVVMHSRQPYAIFVAGIDELGRAKRYNLLMLLLIGNLGGLVLTLLAGWYFAGRLLRPLAEMAESVRHISDARLHTRLHEGNRSDEIARLAMTFNDMLRQLEQSFTSQRSFVAHASHELRTPLTNVLGILDTSLSYDREPEELRRSMQSSIEEIRKIIRLTNSLLNLTKISSEPIVLQPIRLDECLMSAVAQIQQKYPDRTIAMTLADTEEFPVVIGNEALLTTALANVIENACKYSEEAVDVRMQAAATDSNRFEVQVSDRGRGIPVEDLPHIFEPLARGRNVGQTAGFGLGLAITFQLITLHHGQISYRRPSDGIGTVAIISLPAEADTPASVD
ncbi:sensor histidine kinase [Tellurirhabdus rosea]|uniref:sensor histidine kinase n=1 Tax=Tellurirhabdus rosea TaxID=2674997 RepID=UPI00225672BC|nr:HAMP domain-containing sensor histidine kinase [Tellurirhabdus rosea]